MANIILSKYSLPDLRQHDPFPSHVMTPYLGSRRSFWLTNTACLTFPFNGCVGYEENDRNYPLFVPCRSCPSDFNDRLGDFRPSQKAWQDRTSWCWTGLTGVLVSPRSQRNSGTRRRSFCRVCIGPWFGSNLLKKFQRLTLGLMGLDELHLRVLATSSEDVKQRRDAQTGQKHWKYFHIGLIFFFVTSTGFDEEGETLGPGGMYIGRWKPPFSGWCFSEFEVLLLGNVVSKPLDRAHNISFKRSRL